MGKLNIIDRIKDIIGKLAWRVLLWSLNMTAEEYHDWYMEQYLTGKLL